MTVEERRAVREALAPLGSWSFTLKGLKLVCPACAADEWLEGATVPLMHERTQLPDGRVCFHFACPDCGGQIAADFLLWDLGRDIPAHNACFN